MSDDWAFYPSLSSDVQQYVLVDMGLATMIDAHAPATLVTLRLKFEEMGEGGMPSEAEFARGQVLEDALQAFVEENADWFVGRITEPGHRYFFIYTQVGQDEWKGFCRGLIDGGYAIGLGWREDGEHRTYWDALYPSPGEWQMVKDLQVIEQLAESGDDATAERTIDHYAYFPDEAAAESFAAWAKEAGFTHDVKASGRRENGQFAVALKYRSSMALDAIVAQTLPLLRQAEAFGGEYDGWGAPVAGSEGDADVEGDDHTR